MDNKLLLHRADRYNYAQTKKDTKTAARPLFERKIKRRNKRLNWVDVSSHEFKDFVKTLKKNYQLVQKDQACTICWGRVPYIKKQKHMDHWKYIIEAEFFKNARSFLKLCKAHNMIEGRKVALFEEEVPDMVYECERDNSNTNSKFFATDLSNYKKRKIIAPVKHSTLLRTDVSSERIIDENDNVKYHFASQWEKIKESLVKNDQILNSIVGKLKSIMAKNDIQSKKLVSMENTWIHVHSSIESKSMILDSSEAWSMDKIDSAKCQSQPKVPCRDFGIVYDTEDKQFMHKRKVQRIKV